MKKQLLVYLAQAAATLSLFAVFASVGTASIWGMYQPKVPEVLHK
jgi:cyclic lactone autoinducer peptide